ncbi:MAG: TraR/DksA family transcriptional regulator [Anaerolineae bacterium]
MAQEEKSPYDQELLDEAREVLTQAKKWMEQGVAVGDQEVIDYIGGVNAGIDQHQADDASAIYDQALAFTLRNTLATTLTVVKDALKALDDGTYGRCRICGVWIDAERLRALPFTDLCITCAEKKSRGFEPPTY